ncbi:sorting nexin-8-like [Scleropages formosus]|uniref:Sorting nexin-8-like n=1 Tax=Scleropages formosus TaxID=113540 RepID=A0A0P7UM70_SCLFO|nr:sorting nexin-8-like [Scleropages formosus]
MYVSFPLQFVGFLLNVGSVPPYYREVYEALCSKKDERVQEEVFQRLLNKTELPVTVQSQIAEHVKCIDGSLTKLSLYKALALIALAQQGKQPTLKLLENYVQGERARHALLKRKINKSTTLEQFPQEQQSSFHFTYLALRVRLAQESPLMLSLTLANLLEHDVVQLEIIPEKKGLFLKHVEYQMTSQRFKISVYRRYSDFDVFHELLLQRFAYRMVPALPPKRMLKGVLTSTSEREFIEGRRRALNRFINLVARHPLFSEDEMVKTFLTFSGSDIQNKLREVFKRMGDEFLTYRFAKQAKEYLPGDIQAQFSACRELIRNISSSFQKLRDLAERMAIRSHENAADLLAFGRELSILGSDTAPVPALVSEKSTWGNLRQSLKGLSVEFTLLSDKATQQDLCDRHEKGVLHEHQRALHKYSVMKRQAMTAAVQPKEQASVEQLESRIIQQENAIQTMELRNYFSLFCLHQETQLLFIYLPMTSHILSAFITSQIQGHREVRSEW